MCFFRGLFSNNNKFLIEFFKNSTDKIINQMEIYYSKTYNTTFKLTNTEMYNKNYHYTFINNDNTQKLLIEGLLIKESFTYKIIIYNTIHENIQNII
jgi:hypothetical protein